MSTCSICPTSARMVGRDFARIVRISICSPTIFDTSFRRLAMTVFRSRLTGSMIWRRAKVNSCRVSTDARSAPRNI